MPNRSRDILIVEDQNSLSQTLASIFSAVGHPVRSAVDRIPALNEITQRVPDVAISDLNLPGMSDVEFLSTVGDCSLKSS
jgi:CheY-like chemotaxis protein